MSTRILLIDPDAAHTDWLRREMSLVHWTMVIVDTAADAVHAFSEMPFDCIVTELDVPDHRGNLIWIDDLIRHKPATIPLLVCSTIDDLQTRVLALKLGADAVLPKPFDADLFVARIEALVRNAHAQQEAIAPKPYELPPPPPPPMIVGPLEIHRFEARIDGRVLALTPTEFGMLQMLAKSYPEPVAYNDLIIAIWGDHAAEDMERNNLSTHKGRLNAKLEPRFRIALVRGRDSGYRLEIQNHESGSP